MVLAAAVGVGRFVFTPILPLMHAQAGVSSAQGAALATSNYAGYLVGAIAAIAFPRLAHSPVAMKVSGVVVTVTVAGMGFTTSPAFWIVFRGLAGVASAFLFVIAVTAAITAISSQSRHLAGWAYGGVGGGIVVSGVLVLIVSLLGGWREAWWVAGAVTAILIIGGWQLIDDAPHHRPAPLPARRGGRRVRGWFTALAASYFLEGAGYIIAGTFLVAAINATAPAPLGKAAWIVVGVAAIPSCVLWGWLSTRISHPTLLAVALGLQAAGAALGAIVDGPVPAVIAAVLFGGTFMGIATLTLAAGTHLQVPAAVAILSAVYAVGQAAGPVVVAPLLGNGFHDALLLAAILIAAAAAAAAIARIRYPKASPRRLHTRFTQEGARS